MPMVMLDEIDTKIESAVNAKPADDEKEKVEKAFGKETQWWKQAKSIS